MVDPSVPRMQGPEIPEQVIFLSFYMLRDHDFRIVTLPFFFFFLYGIHRLIVWGLICPQPPPRGSVILRL